MNEKLDHRCYVSRLNQYKHLKKVTCICCHAVELAGPQYVSGQNRYGKYGK